ncbi:uncharacterized protein LOC110443881 [Mizuhopecten yessoensis]|uniref:G-protein coupled receptor 112 n=1 Tax=Mizuhopecten yessoensis TaxID=6573 RepID=A0A210PDZ5_MIZYE|nr:uncharacterized protein LOC110443881 [Mizuhopecten yessoensis]OWF34702.1 G-protein coupled receptor 112 [Mizuhopecten yessoensis]
MHRFIHYVKNTLQLFLLFDLLLLSRGQFQGQAPGSAGLFRNGAGPLGDGASPPLFNNAGNVGPNRDDDVADSVGDASIRNPIPKNNIPQSAPSGRRRGPLRSKGVCRDGWKLAEMNNVPICIYVNHKELSWDEAKDTCRQDFGFLLKAEAPVYVDSKSIGEYLRRQEILNIWTGLHEEEGTLVWDELAPHKVRPYNDFMESRLKADRTWDWEIDDDTEDSDVCGDLDLSRLKLPLEEEVFRRRRKRSNIKEDLKIRKRRNPDENHHPEMAFSQHITETLTQSPVETMFQNTERPSERPFRQYSSDRISDNIPSSHLPNSENTENSIKPFQDLAFLKENQPKDGTQTPQPEQQQQQHNLYGQNSEWHSSTDLGEGFGESVPDPVLSEVVNETPIQVTKLRKFDTANEQQQSEGQSQTNAEAGNWNSNIEITSNLPPVLPTSGIMESQKNLEEITPPPNEDGDNDPTVPTTVDNNEINPDIPTPKPLDSVLDFVSTEKDANIEIPEQKSQPFVAKTKRPLEETPTSPDVEMSPTKPDTQDGMLRTLPVTKQPIVTEEDGKENSIPPIPENADQAIDLDLLKHVSEKLPSQTTPSIESALKKDLSHGDSDTDSIAPSFSFVPTIPSFDDVTPATNDVDIPSTPSNFDDVTTTTLRTTEVTDPTKDAAPITGATQISIPAMDDIKTAPTSRGIPLREPPTTTSNDSSETADDEAALGRIETVQPNDKITTAKPSFEFTSPDEFINTLGIIGSNLHKSNESGASKTIDDISQSSGTSSENLKTTKGDPDESVDGDSSSTGENNSYDSDNKDGKDSGSDSSDSTSKDGSDDSLVEKTKTTLNKTDVSHHENSQELVKNLYSNHTDGKPDDDDSISNSLEDDSIESLENTTMADLSKDSNATDNKDSSTSKDSYDDSSELDEKDSAVNSTEDDSNESFENTTVIVVNDKTSNETDTDSSASNDDSQDDISTSSDSDVNSNGNDDSKDDSNSSNSTDADSSEDKMRDNSVSNDVKENQSDGDESLDVDETDDQQNITNNTSDDTSNEIDSNEKSGISDNSETSDDDDVTQNVLGILSSTRKSETDGESNDDASIKSESNDGDGKDNVDSVDVVSTKDSGGDSTASDTTTVSSSEEKKDSNESAESRDDNTNDETENNVDSFQDEGEGNSSNTDSEIDNDSSSDEKTENTSKDDTETNDGSSSDENKENTSNNDNEVNNDSSSTENKENIINDNSKASDDSSSAEDSDNSTDSGNEIEDGNASAVNSEDSTDSGDVSKDENSSEDKTGDAIDNDKETNENNSDEEKGTNILNVNIESNDDSSSAEVSENSINSGSEFDDDKASAVNSEDSTERGDEATDDNSSDDNEIDPLNSDKENDYADSSIEKDDKITSIPIDLELMESIQEADEMSSSTMEDIDSSSDEKNDDTSDDKTSDETNDIISDISDDASESFGDSNEIDSVVIPTTLVARKPKEDDESIEKNSEERIDDEEDSDDVSTLGDDLPIGDFMTLRTFVVEEESDDKDIGDDLRRNFAEKDIGLRIHEHLDDVEEIEEFVPPADKREHIPHSGHHHSQRKTLGMKLSQCTIRKPSVCYSPPIVLEDTASSCPPGWYGHIFSKKCYKVIVSRMPFTAAMERCTNEGGRLAAMGNSKFNADLVLMSILKSQTEGFVVGPSSTFWVERLPSTRQCRALTVNGYMEASCNSHAEVVCERDALIKGQENEDEDDETDDETEESVENEEDHEPERVYLSSKRDDSKLTCDLTNKNRELPTVWFKDGKIVDIKLERRSPSLISLLGVMGRPLTPLPEPALTTSNALELGPMFRKTLEYSSSQKLTNEMFQGTYWCEVWDMHPFNRRRSRSYSVKYSDVITFRGTIEMPEISHKGILLHNMINQQNAKLSGIMTDVNFINDNILPVLQQSIPTVQSVVTYGGKIEDTKPLKLGYYMFLKTTDNYTMADENMAYLVLRKELRDTMKKANMLLTLPGKTPIHIVRSIDLTSTIACPLDHLKDDETGLVATFPRSSIDTVVNSIEMCEGSNAGRASCKGDYYTGAYWTDVSVTKTCNNESHTQSEESEEEEEEEEGIFEKMTLEDRLKELAEMDMEDDNVEGIMEETASIVEKVEEMTATDIDYIAEIMDKTVNVHKITKEIGMNVMKTMDKVMNIDEDELEKANEVSQASNRILKSFEKVAENIDLEDDGKLRIVKPNVAMEVWNLNQIKVPIIGLAARQGKAGRLDEAFNEDRIFTLYNQSQLYGDIDAAIELPPELITSAMVDGKGIKDDTRLYMMVYRDGRLFRGNSKAADKIDVTRDLRLGILNSYIISASISGREVKGLKHKVKTVFKPLQSPANDERKCAFWDFDMNYKEGGWSTAGCVYNGQVNGRDICLCDHLTNFAVLIDFYGQAEPVDRDHEFSLSIISLIGLSLSILGLSLTIISYVFFRKLRQGRAQQTLFNLALAMLCSWVVFLTGIRQTHNYIGCIIVAVLLHYFILSSFMWMLMEAFLQYLTFVKVLGTYVTRYTLKTVVIAWGLPLVPIIIVLSLDPDLYRGGDRYCWMSLDAFYYAFALPIGVIILCNLVVFILTVTSICRRPTGLRSNQSKQKIAITNLQAAITSFVLLGLTWLLGYLAIADARVVFQYAFTILNSLQGFFIFVLFVARKKQVRDQWLILCCCKDPKMEKASRSLSASASIPSTCSGRSSSSYSGRSERSDSTRTTSSFVNNDYETIYTVPYTKHSRESLYYRKV